MLEARERSRSTRAKLHGKRVARGIRPRTTESETAMEHRQSTTPNPPADDHDMPPRVARVGLRIMCADMTKPTMERKLRAGTAPLTVVVDA